MNTLAKSLIKSNCAEYLIIDCEFKILEMSSNISNFADIHEEIQQGQDARICFPELIGTESIVETISRGEEQKFIIEGICRFCDENTISSIDIHIIKNTEYDSLNNELIIFISDATERILLEKSLVQKINETNLLLRNLTASKQYIDTIMTSIPDALLITTSSGIIKKTNSVSQFLLEYNEDELIGQSIFNIIKDLPNNSLEQISDNKFGDANSSLQEVETICCTKNGRAFPAAISYSILQTDIEHFQGYVYILRDVTERKQAELVKQEFLAMITHEVRTPITSVSGMASLLLNSKLTNEQQEFVQTIYTSGESLLKIINDFLDFSKIESGKIDLETQPFNLRSCIHEALYLLAQKAREKHIKLAFIDTPEIPTQIEGDITRLRQILINLLNNSIKFTDTGSIEVSVTTIQKHVTNDQHNNYELKFAVKDTGIGIEKENLERLFKTFSQVNSSITRKYGGTGLGLAICKKLVELMSGKIWVESELGIGSTFYFTIATSAPIIQKETDQITSDAEIDAEMAKNHPLRILLVEDNVINQRMIKLMLQRMGYQPSVASNGLEALATLHAKAYDVVLMDVQMPEMDGLTATQQICQEWTADNRPWIIALTASAMWGERDRCLASGMDDYLSKPIRIKELMDVLKKCQPLNSHINISQQNIQENQMQETKNQKTIENSIHPAALYEILQMASFNPSVDALEFLFETIDYYLEETPRFLQDIHTYIDQNNYQALRRAAHTLSSTSATLGAVNLATLCTELEIMTVNQEFDLDEIINKITEVESEYQLVQVALEIERENTKNSTKLIV
jgi:PAS domain S-box-containing protein